MWVGAESIVLIIIVALSSWLWIVKTVPKTVISKMKMKWEKKKHTCGPRDIINISWAFFLFGPPLHYSTHNPPHKQLLMRLGVGGVSFAAPCLSSPPSSGPFPCVPPHGPCHCCCCCCFWCCQHPDPTRTHVNVMWHPHIHGYPWPHIHIHTYP